MTLRDHSAPIAEAQVTSVKAEGSVLSISLSMPAMRSGSTAELVTVFQDSRGDIDHQVTTTLSHLGSASSRTVKVRIPSRLPTGAQATVTLVANTTGANAALTTSSHTVHLGRSA